MKSNGTDPPILRDRSVLGLVTLAAVFLIFSALIYFLLFWEAESPHAPPAPLKKSTEAQALRLTGLSFPAVVLFRKG